MADKLDAKETVMIEELTISISYEICSSRFRVGLLTREEVIEEIKNRDD